MGNITMYCRCEVSAKYQRSEFGDKKKLDFVQGK